MTQKSLIAVAAIALSTGCSTTPPELKALWDEYDRLEDGAAAPDDHGLDEFVAKCDAVAQRMERSDDRFHALTTALGLCRWGGSYDHARAIRARLMDELLPQAKQDHEREVFLLIEFAWVGRSDPHELEREGEEFRDYIDAIGRATDSSVVRTQCLGAKIQYLMQRDGCRDPMTERERELALALIDEIEPQLDRIAGKAFGYDGREQYEADRAGLTRNRLGMVADEIEGSDLDGVPFKLSDYRGKVVVLDFWGFW